MATELADHALIAAADALAERAHHGQTDKAGRPYIEHVRAVAAAVDQINSYTVAAALLHDIVEDTSITLNDLRGQGFPESVVAAVDLLTKRKGVPNTAYYAGICADPIALDVKLADVGNNSAAHRLAELDGDTRARLIGKYRTAFTALGRPDLAAAIVDTGAR